MLQNSVDKKKLEYCTHYLKWGKKKRITLKVNWQSACHTLTHEIPNIEWA